jgi:phospholipase/carboxylesterase
MNRIPSPAKSVAEKVPQPLAIESALFTAPSHDTTWALFTPMHYEPNYAYPLLVWLHGPAENDERQLLRIMPMVSLRNFVAVAPRGFPGERAPGGAGYRWPQTPDHIGESEHRVFESIRAAESKCNIASQRIFLAGYGEGGTMAFRIAMNHPQQFAGVVSLCGAFPTGNNPFGNLPLARKLPIFLAVGRDSGEYSPERACDDLRLFHTAGMSVSLRQYPCGQQLSPQMLRDIDRWIIEQITSPGGRQEEPAEI